MEVSSYRDVGIRKAKMADKALKHISRDFSIFTLLTGNSMLLRVLPSVYEKRPQPINNHLTELVALMSQLEQAEQHHLLRLFQIVARRKQPEVNV